MKIFVNKDFFSSLKNMPSIYEYERKSIYIDDEQDLLDIKDLKNINSITIDCLEDSIESIDLSIVNEIEEIYITYFNNLQQINGINEQPNLKIINYPGHESIHNINLITNIIQQLDIKKLLSHSSSNLLLSAFAIPVLKQKYPNFFSDFSLYSDKISFADITNKVLQTATFSTCSFEEARQVELMLDEWINENISSKMGNIEKFSRIYRYVLNIDYDFDAAKDDVIEEKHKQACSMAKVLLNKKGICVGYVQVLKYIALKCGLQCEYVEAYSRRNYDVQVNELDNYMSVFPKNRSKAIDFVVPNHVIIRFSPDGINWLFSDPTHDSLFTRIALEKNKFLKNWPTFCLPQNEMELFNVPYMYDLNGDKIVVTSQLTEENAEEVKVAMENMLNQSEQQKRTM